MHITEATRQALKGAYEVEPGSGHERSKYLADHKTETWLVIHPKEDGYKPPHKRPIQPVDSKEYKITGMAADRKLGKHATSIK